METKTPYAEIAAMVPPGVKPWLWSVTDHMAARPFVGLGVSDDRDRAKAAVEDTMTRYRDRSAFGVLQGPYLARERCLRNGTGTYTWLECR